VFLADRVRAGGLRRPGLVRRMREGSGLVLCGLGLTLAFARRPV
jgi:threonine/homoserine/homoserine lactone efflux protein